MYFFFFGREPFEAESQRRLRIRRLSVELTKELKIDYISVAHAVHRLNGIVTPASAAYNQQELEYQLKATNANVLFTCGGPLLETALKAAETVKLPRDRIFIVDTALTGYKPVQGFVTVAQLIDEGSGLPALPKLQWLPGQGVRQVAFICFSSGTSGLPVSLSCPRVVAYPPSSSSIPYEPTWDHLAENVFGKLTPQYRKAS